MTGGQGARGYISLSVTGLALAVLAKACSVGLVGLSGWFIAGSAVAGASAYSAFSYLSPSGGVRAFALGRIVANYASRVVLHSAALRRIGGARLAFYDRAAAQPAARGTWSGQSLDRVMADADTKGTAFIEATTPAVVAAAMCAGGGLVIGIAGNLLVAVTVTVAVAGTACAGLAVAAARHTGDEGRTRGAARRTGQCSRSLAGGRDFSGGEQRRLHIARALATRPGVLLPDEPTTGLDTRTGSQVLKAIRTRLPQAVLIVALHEPPGDEDALGLAWKELSLN